ncbi:MAG: GGDEF domain-containing protein [Clostridia bacterium]|nr:GGDEF domain-containing protein [Clostridia bacterium]
MIKKIKKHVMHFWHSLETLDERIYFMTLFVAVASGIITCIAGVIQRLPFSVQAITFFILVFTLILLFFSMKHPEYRQGQRIVLVIVINFIFFPLTFFAAGGIHSGMSLFFLVGLFLVAIMLRGNLGGIVFVLSLLLMELTVTMSNLFPQFVSEVTKWQHYQDVKVTLFLSGLPVYAITTLILTAYNRERDQNARLMEKLRNLSTRDELSGLYNRRELFRRLEIAFSGEKNERNETLKRDNLYVAMFDVDNFKHLNDAFGHGFGDTVLSRIAGVLDRFADIKKGELASRYGGEEFVSVLSAGSLEEAYNRAEEIRRNVVALHFDEVPDLVVTLSGGVISCAGETEIKKVMHDVDELLYQAKAAGKNRIFCK